MSGQCSLVKTPFLGDYNNTRFLETGRRFSNVRQVSQEPVGAFAFHITLAKETL